MPESFEYAINGGRKYLLRNKGDGSFEDVTAALGITSRRWTLAVVAADLLGTGYPDLFFANDYGVSELYANQGGKRFVDVAQTAGVGRTPKSGMNASLGDVFNDGRPAIYKTNISEPGVLVQGNDLWVPARRAASRRGLGAGVREPGVRAGRRPRRLELGRAVRRSEQRRHAGPVPDQRLRVGGRAQQLLVRLLGDRRRPQHDHRRRGQLAGDARPQPVGLPAQAGLAERRPGHLHRGGAGRRCHRCLRRARRGPGRLRQPRRAGRGGGQPARPAAAVSQHGRPGAALDRLRAGGRAPATAAPSAHGSSCTGPARCSARTWWRPAGSARRTSGGCTSALAPPRRSSAP